MKHIYTLLLLILTLELYSQSTIIGTTGYDLQTNSCTRNRLNVYADGSISAVWTGTVLTDFVWADRGMFYNHFNGATWNPMPTARIETVRTGFGEILKVKNHEVIISHDGLNIRLFANATIGGTSWTELPGSTQITGMWPVTDCPAGTDDIYVVSTDGSFPNNIIFSRSDDGGNSWTVLESILPGLSEADGFSALTAEVYQMQVKGTHVYVVYGSTWTDLKLLHSADKGNPGTWTETIIMDFPIDNYSGEIGQNSDYNGDGIADTIITNDGFHEMIITNDGTVHFFSGNYWLLDNNPASEGWSYFPSISGLVYWNSTMTEPTDINLLIDWDGDGDAYGGIGSDLGMYDGVTFTSMPSAAYDESTGNIYLIYTMPIEFSDYYGDPALPEAQSFRDLFGVYSTDNGITWSAPINLTNTAESFNENVYPNVFDKVVDGKIHVVWMQDEEPGTSLDGGQLVPDPAGFNNIRYQSFNVSDFDVDPTCDIPVNLFADPIYSTVAQLHWDPATGADKYQVLVYQVSDPTIKFKKKPESNMVTITGLTPETEYAFSVKTICPGEIFSPYSATAFFTTGPLKAGEINSNVAIYPNPNDGEFTIQLPDILNANVEIKITDAMGKIVFINDMIISIEDQQENIDLSNLSSGIYYIQMMCNGNLNAASVIIE